MQQQLIPSNLLYSQVIAQITDLSNQLDNGTIKDVLGISQALSGIITRISTSSIGPLTEYEPVEDSEPPLSAKMNRFWNGVIKDVPILQNQMDALQASAIFTHNFITTELLRLSGQNDALRESIRTLQLFSNSVTDGAVVFGSSFASLSGFDTTFPVNDSMASIQGGVLVLGSSGAVTDFASSATITVLDSSNGFLGDNQEIQDPSLAITNPVTGEPQYRFVAETLPANNLPDLTDGNPTTWVEYEHYSVAQADQLGAQNFGFTYQAPNDSTGSLDTLASLVDWANVPDGFQLKLSLSFDLGTAQPINYISYNPYGLSDNQNYPVEIRSVQISEDNQSWTTVAPANIFVGTNANLQTARVAPNVNLGPVSWSFPAQSVRFVNLDVVQPNSLPSNIGHLYYLDQTGNRQEGPVPSIKNPSQYDDPSNFSFGGQLTQHIEFFVGQRWAIGIRDFVIQQNSFQISSSIVSQPMTVNGLIDQVSLEADYTVPSDFPTDQEWVNFFISPDNGASWFQISRITDTGLSIPEVISFNNPVPAPFRDPGIAYYTVNNPVNSVRLKLQMMRPTDPSFGGSSPQVNSYKVKIVTR